MPTQNLQICPANGKQRHVVLTNKKQDNFDKIHADNVQQSNSNGVKVAHLQLYPYFVLDLCQLQVPGPLHEKKKNIEKPDIYFSSRSSTREYFPYWPK
jgi:hypothetical protein